MALVSEFLYQHLLDWLCPAMEAALKIVKGECRISAITKCTNVMGGVDFNLSANEDLDTTVRKGITTALEKRIAELKQEFEEL